MHPDRQKSELQVPPEKEGWRLDLFMVSQWPDYSRSYFQKCILDHLVFVNNRHSRPSQTLKTGDKVVFLWPLLEVGELQAEDIPLEIIYEDSDLLALNKQAGLVVHPASGNRTGTLVQGLLHYDEETFEELSDENLRPGIVHRLDKYTSGVLVVAKNQDSFAALKNIFKERLAQKTYLAIVAGEFDSLTGSVEGQIGRHPQNRLKMAVVPEGGKYALTRYRVIAAGQGCTLLKVRLHTGRTHQIRVHLSSLRHPVLGDRLYGGGGQALPCQPQRQMLHAWKLAFKHPGNGQLLELTAPPPADFCQTAAALGLTLPSNDSTTEEGK
ncbi:MAG: RluA family pseudouridine synthase [Lentisphaerae bacterium]|nr:RluA family pseudouridine synthase [Lentisphaerota bacterium]